MFTPEQQAAIDAEVAKQVAQMKSNLDNAYAARDAAQQAQRTAEERAAAVTRERDAAVLQARETAKTEGNQALEAVNKRVEMLETRNRTLSRESAIGAALAAYTFVSPAAQQMARQHLESQVQENTADGSWKAADGRDLPTLAKAAFESDDLKFLLKPALSTGTGQQQQQGKDTNPPPGNKRLMDSSNEEILARHMK